MFCNNCAILSKLPATSICNGFATLALQRQLRNRFDATAAQHAYRCMLLEQCSATTANPLLTLAFSAFSAILNDSLFAEPSAPPTASPPPSSSVRSSSVRSSDGSTTTCVIVCVYVCVYVHAHIYVYAHICMYVYVCVDIHVCEYICIDVNVYMHIQKMMIRLTPHRPL